MFMLQLWPHQAARADTADETLGSSVLAGGREKEWGHCTPLSSQKGQVKCIASQGCFHTAGHLCQKHPSCRLPEGLGAQYPRRTFRRKFCPHLTISLRAAKLGPKPHTHTHTHTHTYSLSLSFKEKREVKQGQKMV